VIDYVSCLCLTQFRADVFTALARDGAVKREAVEAATSRLLPLCYKTLRVVVTDGEPWLVTGNKLAIKDIHRLVDYLFDVGRFYV
jgi:hypothetical protein